MDTEYLEALGIIVKECLEVMKTLDDGKETLTATEVKEKVDVLKSRKEEFIKMSDCSKEVIQNFETWARYLHTDKLNKETVFNACKFGLSETVIE